MSKMKILISIYPIADPAHPDFFKTGHLAAVRLAIEYPPEFTGKMGELGA